MAVVEYYVAPGGVDDLAAGRGASSGDPWATPEFALDTGILDTGQGVDGDRLNFAAGSWTLTKNLGTCTYFTASSTGFVRPFFYAGAGSDSSALDGDATYSIHDNVSDDSIGFRDLELKNTGSNFILRFDNWCSVVRCKIHGTTTSWIDTDQYPAIMDCEFYDCSGTDGILIPGSPGSVVSGNYFHDTINGPSSYYVNISALGSRADYNRVRINSAFSGIVFSIGLNGDSITHNSIYANAATGTAIENATYAADINGNVIEGFSGVGGKGITGVAGNYQHMITRNAVYNCTTPYTNTDESDGVNLSSDNETLGSSPFANAAGGDFTPVDVGNVWGGGWPTGGGSQPDKGAVQRLAGGGNGGDIYPYPRPRIFGIG